MRYRSLLECVVVLFACLASGTLECGGAAPTAIELRGAHLYVRMCAVCHGAHGQGYAADQAPALSNQAFLASASHDLLRTAIDHGRSGTTMSAWSRARGGPLSAEDAEAIIAFLDSMRERPRVALDESPAAGDPGRGAGIFERECARCHGASGIGGPFVHIGNFDFLAVASDGFLRQAIRGGRPGTAMTAFEAALGVQGVDDVVAAMRSWQTRPAPFAQPAARPPPPMPLGPVPLNPRGAEPTGFQAAPRTTPADRIKAALDRRARMALLDARAPSDYMNEHIAGAVSVPFYDPDPYFSQLPKDAWLVCYCACPHAESGSLAQKLTAAGFTKVTVLDEGLGVWKAKQYPTHTGSDP